MDENTAPIETPTETPNIDHLLPHFDSSQVGDPYSRVMSFHGVYASEMTASVEVITQRHVRLKDSTHEPLSSAETLRFNITKEQLQRDVIELRDPSTGVLTGRTMTKLELFIGLGSLIREQEIAAAKARINGSAHLF